MKRRVTLGLALSCLACAGLALSGLGSRWGWWYYTTGFQVMSGSATLAAAALIVSLAGCWASARRRRWWRFVASVLGVAIGASVMAIPLSLFYKVQTSPPLLDVTTDPDDPPRFEALLAERGDATVPAEYAGPEAAVIQRGAYPDVRPLLVDVSPARAFDRALVAAGRLGWRVVAVNREEGSIEAVDTTYWFGFKDDVVVRIRASGEGSRVDVRSASRVGDTDLGVNARRILKFFAAL